MNGRKVGAVKPVALYWQCCGTGSGQAQARHMSSAKPKAEALRPSVDSDCWTSVEVYRS